MASKNTVACLNVFPSLDYIELVKLDENGEQIDLTASLPVFFDQASRSITDTEQFATTIRDLYDVARIPLTTPTMVIVPSFFTREIELPSEFSEDEIRIGLVSEAERFYIFKKSEPQIDWVRLRESVLLYSAFPKSEIDKYLQVFRDNKIPLVGIDLGYFSILRGLAATGPINEEIQNNGRWVMIVLSDFTFCAMVLEGTNILKLIETPLSVGSDDEDVTLTDIQQDFQAFIGSDPYGKVILVNNANKLSSDNVMSRLSHLFQGQVVLIEQNGMTLRSRGASDGRFPCSLEAVGGVTSSEFPTLPSINFSPDSGEDFFAIMEYRKKVQLGLLVLNGVAILMTVLLWLGLTGYGLWRENELNDLKKQNDTVAQIKTNTSLDEVKRKLFVKKSVDENVQMNDLVVRVGALLPPEMWLTGLTVTKDPATDAETVEITGGSLVLDSVNLFLNSLNDKLKRTDLEVSKAEMVTNPDNQSYNEWVIKTKSTTPAQ